MILFLNLILMSFAFANNRVLAPLDEHLNEFNFLKNQVKVLEEKVLFPAAVRLSLKGALSKSDFEVRSFSQEFKSRYGFPRELGGLAVYPITGLKIVAPFEFFMSPQEMLIRAALGKVAEESSEPAFSKDYTVFLPDEEIRGSAYNPLLVLVHEFAHVDFHRRLSVIRKNAVMPLRRDLFTYVNERYAHEMEYLLLQSIRRHPSLFHVTPEKWRDRVHLREGLTARRSISRYVRETYGLRSVELARLDSVPLDDLLNLMKD